MGPPPHAGRQGEEARGYRRRREAMPAKLGWVVGGGVSVVKLMAAGSVSGENSVTVAQLLCAFVSWNFVLCFPPCINPGSIPVLLRVGPVTSMSTSRRNQMQVSHLNSIAECL